jgi:hypothetical protein
MKNLRTSKTSKKKKEVPAYSYKQRINALREFGKKAEKELEQELEADFGDNDQKKTTAFFLFAKEKKPAISKEYPELKGSEIARILG